MIYSGRATAEKKNPLMKKLGEKIFEIYWGPMMGGSVEGWFAYVIALVFLLFKPQGLFGEKIIERV